MHQNIPLKQIESIVACYNDDIFKNESNKLDNIKGIGQLLIKYNTKDYKKNKISAIKLDYENKNCKNLIRYIESNLPKKFLGINSTEDLVDEFDVGKKNINIIILIFSLFIFLFYVLLRI